jgi:hypothetical protein
MRAAGHLEEETPEQDAIDRAFQFAVGDKDFDIGHRLRDSELTAEVKLYIIRAYERASGRVLMPDESGDP